MDFLTYGTHDENTLAQMTTCMSFDDAAAGVLCADGHLGYAHPIGGVVGYTDHISISGVGFDIVHTLSPFGVIMAGANEFDPYKD